MVLSVQVQNEGSSTNSTVNIINILATSSSSLGKLARPDSNLRERKMESAKHTATTVQPVFYLINPAGTSKHLMQFGLNLSKVRHMKVKSAIKEEPLKLIITIEWTRSS